MNGSNPTQQIIIAVCQEFKVTPEELAQSKAKSETNLFFAKAACTYLIRRVYNTATNAETMQLLGYKAKTFSPIMYNVKQVRNLLHTDKGGFMAQKLNSIAKALYQDTPPVKAEWGEFREVGEIPKIG